VGKFWNFFGLYVLSSCYFAIFLGENSSNVLHHKIEKKKKKKKPCWSLVITK
jgi:hypothetical protein